MAEWNLKLVEYDIIINISKNKNKSISQIKLKWLLQKNMTLFEYIKQNFGLNGFYLIQDEMHEIDSLKCINYKTDLDSHSVLLLIK